MLVQVDVDSTLYDADPLFARIARENGVVWLDRDTHWRPAESLSMEDGSVCNRDILGAVFKICHGPECVPDNVPYPDAADVLRRLITENEDVEIAYVSDRNETQTQVLYEWLEAHNFLHFPGQHVVTTTDKRDWMREHKPDIVIDDRVRTLLMAVYELGAAGITLAHNHNINLKGEAPNIYVVNDWLDIEEVLKVVVPKVESKELV